MSDQSSTPPASSPSPSTETPAERPAPTLRETIEAAYDSSEAEDAGQDDRPRDSYGRFAPKERAEPGEAEPKEAPSPDKPIAEETQKRPTEPAVATAASSTQPPDHWSAEDKALFSRLPQDGQQFIMRRHQEMEADYTRKSQASSGAVNFARALSPVFNDPVIQGSLQQGGMNPVEAVQQWADFHRRAINPDPREKINLLVDLSQRMGLDPARLFAIQSPQVPGLSPKDMADPAIRHFADHISRTQSEIQTLKNQLQQMRDAEVAQRQQESLDQTRWGIDQFAAEKDQSGKPLRPHFDRVLPHIIKLYQADPAIDLNEAYETGVRMDAELYRMAIEEERNRLQSQSSLDRAKAASRGNTRGITSPVAKPNAKTGNGTLRDLLEATADEVGL